ncbi:MAG: transcription-repair coupling factor [Acidimicrobiaceae bacterium]|nr:transcription-repair coupling factor [Acidimicrobiaceae bacterium]
MGSLQSLLPLLAKEPALANLLGRLSASLVVPESAQAMVLAGLSIASDRRPLLVATPTRNEAERLAFDLTAFLGLHEVEELPAWETLPFERVSPSVETMGRRIKVLHRLVDADASQGKPRVVVASARALAQQVHKSSVDAPIMVKAGDTVDQGILVERLVMFGYQRQHQVECKGEIALRGSIVDIYPSTASTPVRIDFWGDEIERLMQFSVSDQRTSLSLDEVEIYPCREMRPDQTLQTRATALVESEPWGRENWQRLADGQMFEGMESWWSWLMENPSTVVELLPEGAAVVLIEPRRLRDRITRIQTEEEDLVSVLSKTWETNNVDVPRLHAAFEDIRALDGVPVWTMPVLPDSPGVHAVKASGWDTMSGGPGSLKERIHRVAQLIADGYKVVFCATPSEARSIDALLADSDVQITRDSIAVELERGAILADTKLAVLTASDITGYRRRSRRCKPLKQASRSDIRSSRSSYPDDIRGRQRFFEDLSPGSFVVHDRHGIARFEGMVRRTIGGYEREYLLLAYRGEDKLYVPSDQLEQVHHYTGGDKPSLSRMGGSEWSATKSRVRTVVAEVARDLVKLYQKRITTAGSAFSEDTQWQRELEESFEYQETADQLRVLAEVKTDMERPVPMDRLIVGDVGFGKTEIALRAAFKAVQDGRQVAILTPTTLLAHQHSRTLKERFAPFPVRVEMLSRFLTTKQIRTVVDALSTGEVDVVVGTHRLLSGDVRFRSLGLLVVDEEQRFGVRHKEKIKSLRADVDVLTLTATPVPRTLEMSLTGIRDLSLLNTPPTDRQPILTYIGEQDERPVAEAIRRELMREGQVFYVHNRVADIERSALKLRRLVPEARVAVAHGQMDENSLEQVVLDFAEQRYDVLVCTTIIESGIDMPTVNTLVVDRADKLGLGQLHQIRGRVGRSGRRAYAYLFYPTNRVLSEQAYERLKTIGEAVDLGSGYRIAMRDLEIRGAGNLLGEAQSGHIAAVGYDLYCQLVSEAVAELKGETPAKTIGVHLEIPVDAYIPDSYISQESSRLEAYRRLSGILKSSELKALKTEWIDRFGPLPPEVKTLLAVGRLRLDCLRSGIYKVVVVEFGKNETGLGGGYYQAKLAAVLLKASRQARLQRLYGPDAVYKADLAELHVRLSTAKGPVVRQLRKLIAEIIASDKTAASSS